ncbi:MAG: GGDEF domain-containing protein [Treponema sp.]|jgi:diguanylate cyclase (GGDEF)-like protein|nr:GGDEF domain-containing protein [Treponema sp.]
MEEKKLEEAANSIAPIDNPALLKSPLFVDMSELEYNALTAFLERSHIKTGDTVFKEGDEGKEMYILLSGSVSAYVNQSDGTQRQLFDVKPGDFFGEMSIIANEPRSATMTAREETDIMVLQGIDFYRIVFDHPMIGVKMLKAICRVQNSWLDQSSKHLSDLTRWGETARRRAITDELTGLHNRRFLEDSIIDRFAHGSIGLRKVALLMMDLDKIHAINEQHGVQAGDDVFKAVAGVIRLQIRSGDIAARLSGDEFAVLLPDTDVDDAKQIAERIRETVFTQKIPVPKTAGSTDAGKVEISVRVSIGIALAPDHAKDSDSLMHAADKALSRAKELGRNRVEIA